MIFWNQVVEKVPRYIGNNLGAKGSNKYRERTGRSGNQNSIHPIALRPAARTAGSSSRLVWRCAELSSIFAIRSDLVGPIWVTFWGAENFQLGNQSGSL